MDGIDISNWQSGINISALPSSCRFVIVKATQGSNFVSNSYRSQVSQTLSSGRLLGVYHYVDGSGASAEASNFVSNTKNLIGKSIFAIDWESGSNSKWGNVSYLRSVVSEVIRLTGKVPFIYTSSSSLSSVKGVADSFGCPLWIAQYPNYNPTGFQATPWNEGTYSCTIRQYSSTGRISGYSGNLDLNKCYWSEDRWNSFVGNKTTSNKEDDMPYCFVYGSDQWPGLKYFDGSSIHELHNPDELNIIKSTYKEATGHDIPILKFGSNSAPWATRFEDAINRKR